MGFNRKAKLKSLRPAGARSEERCGCRGGGERRWRTYTRQGSAHVPTGRRLRLRGGGTSTREAKNCGLLRRACGGVSLRCMQRSFYSKTTARTAPPHAAPRTGQHNEVQRRVCVTRYQRLVGRVACPPPLPPSQVAACSLPRNTAKQMFGWWRRPRWCLPWTVDTTGLVAGACAADMKAVMEVSVMLAAGTWCTLSESANFRRCPARGTGAGFNIWKSRCRQPQLTAGEHRSRT